MFLQIKKQMKLALAALMSFTPISALADVNDRSFQSGFSKERTCYRSEYREEYVPGTADNPGYIKSWNETIEVPCDGKRTSTGTTIHRHTTVEYDNNDCSEGTLAGGLLGGGIAAAISRGNGRWWAIPTGIVTGAMIGCDIDGG